MSVTIRKKGYMVRCDIGGLNNNSTYTISNADLMVGYVPVTAVPLATVYFPMLFRLKDDSSIYVNYAQIYFANAGNSSYGILLHFNRTSGIVVQLMAGVTYLSDITQ